ncbi:four-carbon acid sugar kinase family protein [Halobacteria archaeon HArc-gm2]|nr:four-carbon acid sugar kinase family protein [Halobacteria archaeon HArc-gm2]
MTVTTLVVADDRSGACDTGHQFAARGRETVVVGRRDRSATADVLVVDTDSRYADASTAAERVRDAVTTRDPDLVYKKVDSTLRGNLVAEVDAALTASGADLALVAPAFPAEGRTTVGGYHLVDGTPVAETAAGSDSDAPVETSHLPTRFSGSNYQVDHIPIDAVGDASTVAGRLADAASGDDPTVLTCDAATDDHLAAIAAGAADATDAADSPLDVLYVGSAGLARHVTVGSESGPILGVVGSASPRTFDQLDALPDEQVVALDGPALIDDEATAVSAAVDQALDRLGKGTSTVGTAVVVTAAKSPTDVDATLQAAEEAGLSGASAREHVASGLAAVAARVTEASSPGAYLLSGGAVAAATLDALDADGIRLTGQAVEDGVPIGRVVGGAAATSPVATKAGAFGDRRTIRNCLGALAGYDE